MNQRKWLCKVGIHSYEERIKQWDGKPGRKCKLCGYVKREDSYEPKK